VTQITPTTPAWPRFDGAAAWAALTAEQQAAIGTLALESAVNWRGYLAYANPNGEEVPYARPFVVGEALLEDRLTETCVGALRDLVPALHDATKVVPIPSLLGRICRTCGCSQIDPCDEGCGWAEYDLRTACVSKSSCAGRSS
jgi:hypothetical protein